MFILKASPPIPFNNKCQHVKLVVAKINNARFTDSAARMEANQRTNGKRPFAVNLDPLPQVHEESGQGLGGRESEEYGGDWPSSYSHMCMTHTTCVESEFTAEFSPEEDDESAPASPARTASPSSFFPRSLEALTAGLTLSSSDAAVSELSVLSEHTGKPVVAEGGEMGGQDRSNSQDHDATFNELAVRRNACIRQRRNRTHAKRPYAVCMDPLPKVKDIHDIHGINDDRCQEGGCDSAMYRGDWSSYSHMCVTHTTCVESDSTAQFSADEDEDDHVVPAVAMADAFRHGTPVHGAPLLPEPPSWRDELAEVVVEATLPPVYGPLMRRPYLPMTSSPKPAAWH